ncbi:MAG: carboxypeptidase regulatory-like domain-containing protein, partial [Bacteroidota bacterium]
TTRTDIATEGYGNAEAEVEIPTAGEAEVTLRVDVTRGEIRGTVGVPAASVTVTDVATSEVVRSVSATSSGAYRATLLPAGTYRVRPQRTGFTFTPATRDVTVGNTGEATASFTANSVQATLVVQAFRAGNPLSDVQVTVISADGAITQTGTTDAEGTARFASLTGGLTYTVGATRAGFQTSPATQTVALAVGATETIQFTLTASTARLSGTVQAEGERLGGALITATTAAGASFSTTQPDVGAYVLDNLPAATYTVAATRDGYRSAEQTIALSDGEVRDDIDFDLIPELVRLTGEVRYAGAGLSEVNVTATGPTTRSAVTDADGRFTITAPLSGTATDTTVYVVSIGGDGTLPRRTAVLPLTGAQTGTTIPVPAFVVPSGQVVFRLTDGLQPLANVTVQLVGEAGQFQTGQTDAAGQFASGATLERGAYRLAISTADRLLPDEALFRVVLASDTDRVTRTMALPYRFVRPAAVTSTDPTPIRIAFPTGFTPAGAAARFTYRPTPAAPQETRPLKRDGDAFVGTLPPTFSLDPIEVIAEVQSAELTYRSAPLQLVPTRSGVLSALQVVPNLDGTLLRPNDTYLLSLQLFDGLGEPIVFAEANGTVAWTSDRPAAQLSLPDSSTPTSAQLRVTAPGMYTVTVRAMLNGLTRTRSFTFRVEDAALQEMTLAAPVTRLANTAPGIRLAYTGVLPDGTGLTLGEEVQWRVTPAAVGVVDAGGFFRPTDPQFIGPFTIQLDDPLSGLQATTTLDLFARVDGAQDYLLTSGPRLALTLPQGAIPFPAEIGLASGATALANQQVFDAERRAFRVAAPTYRVQFRANQALPGDSLAADAALALQFTPRDTLGAAAVTMARYNPGQLQWAPYRDAETAGQYVMTEQVRRLGEFGVLLQSTPLGLEHAAVLPSPFSPDVGVAKIGYILSTTAPPARVDVTVYNLQGERIRTLLADDPQLPGRYGGRTSLKPIAWDGRTDSGRLARNGRYVIRIRARDSSGEVTQLLPVVLVK